MIDAQKTTIDGAFITVNPFPARKGLKIKAKLFRYLSKPVFKLVSGIGDIDKLKEIKGVGDFMNADLQGIDFSQIGEALSLVFENLTDDQLDVLITDLVSGVFIGEKAEPLSRDDVFNEYVSGNYMFLYKVIGFVIKMNFASFLKKGDTSSE